MNHESWAALNLSPGWRRSSSASRSPGCDGSFGNRHRAGAGGRTHPHQDQARALCPGQSSEHPQLLRHGRTTNGVGAWISLVEQVLGDMEVAAATIHVCDADHREVADSDGARLEEVVAAAARRAAVFGAAVQHVARPAGGNADGYRVRRRTGHEHRRRYHLSLRDLQLMAVGLRIRKPGHRRADPDWGRLPEPAAGQVRDA